MSLLSKLFTLLGGQSKSNADTKGSTPIPFYLDDHLLTSQERKEYSIQFLQQQDVPILASLPLIEDHTTARFRTAEEVAAKAVVLYGLIFVANREKSAEEMITYIKQYHLWESVSPEERAYLEKPFRTDKDNNPFTWRIETLNVLLWALGNFETLPFPVATCDFRSYTNLPNLEADPAPWIQQAHLRNHEDILNQADLIYRIHWAARNAYLKNQPPPSGLNYPVVFERHFALNWLTIYADDWDDITTDT